MIDTNWNTFYLNKIFDIQYGNKMDLCQMVINPDSKIAFVTRTSQNNGVGAYVEEVDDVKPYDKGLITVALGGSIGSTFVQPNKFYTAQNVAVLKPNCNHRMSLHEKMFIATIIKKECDLRFVAFGRELNKHLNTDFTIKLPSLNNGEDIDWEYIDDYMSSLNISFKLKTNNLINHNIDISSWKRFPIKNIFSHFEKGKVHRQDDLPDGKGYFYIGAKKSNGGVMLECGKNSSLLSKGNCIAFICNGQGSVGYANYIDRDSYACGDLILAYSDKINKYTAMFLVTIIDMERPKYSFGRKWTKYLKDTEILLPVCPNGDIDWDYMESYIKSTPYGDLI